MYGSVSPEETFEGGKAVYSEHGVTYDERVGMVRSRNGKKKWSSAKNVSRAR